MKKYTLNAYIHRGFWQSMDSFHDKIKLDNYLKNNLIILLMINFWKNKKILVTGHTGFKGSWLTMLLIYHGAKVYGISSNTSKSKDQKNYLISANSKKTSKVKILI